MRVSLLERGGTYLVEVPHTLPRSRYSFDPQDRESIAVWWGLNLLRGCRFRLTVTEIDATSTPPAVEGMRVTRQSMVDVDLTLDQAAALGLPPGLYSVRGVLRDTDDEPVTLPEVVTMRVPARWLRDADAVRPPTHRDIDAHPIW